MGILLCDDLLFSSRITATARAAGLPMRIVRSFAEIESMAGNDARCVIIDLSLMPANIANAVARIRTAQRQPFVVAYGSHVDAALLRSAREAGCDVVLPRSKFVEQLPTELKNWVSKHGQPTGVSDA